MARIYCTSDVTIYVSPSGSDSNSGLSTSSPLKTIQAAVRKIYYEYDLAGFYGFVQLMDGTYTEHVSVYGQVLGSDQIIFRGNSGDYGAVQWIAPQGQSCCSVQDQAIGIFSAISFSAPNGGACLVARQNAVIDFLNCRLYGATVHLSATLNSTLNINGYYAIMAGANTHLEATNGGNILVNGVAASVINACSFTYFARAAGSGANINFGGASYSGAAVTGGKGLVANNAVIDLGGTTIPGTTAVVVQTGGQLV